MTGWYPDPGGTPGRYRYWDGATWSDETTDDPAHPPPLPGGRPQPSPPRRHRPGAAIGIAALVLVIVVVSAVLIIRHRDATGLTDPDPPSSTMTGWDDSSPVPTEPASPSPSGSASGRQTCPEGDPARTALHPEDDRVHGGRLSMPAVDGYSDPEPEYRLSWMYDTNGMQQTTEPGWVSIFAVGEVPRTDGFDSLRSAARASMQCAVDTSWYLHFTGSRNIRDEATTVDGHRAWVLSTEVRVDDPNIEAAGDQLTFVVVDDGRSEAYSVWCGMVPLGDQERLRIDDSVLADLQVTD